jgi:hypothetical protein
MLPEWKNRPYQPGSRSMTTRLLMSMNGIYLAVADRAAGANTESAQRLRAEAQKALLRVARWREGQDLN